MEDIHIKGSHGKNFVPKIDFNAETGLCEISGESYLEDTVTFYASILEWLENFTSNVKKSILFNFKLTYFNTSTSKSILDILTLLKGYENTGGKVTVNWYYDDEEEEDIEAELEDVEDLIIETGMKINLIPMNGDDLYSAGENDFENDQDDDSDKGYDFDNAPETKKKSDFDDDLFFN